MCIRQTILWSFLLATLVATSEARADWGFWGPYSSGYTQDYVPYFAAHPPVYYGSPIARPYGWSPYPLPPVPACSSPPLVVENRFVVGNSPGVGGVSQQPVPLRILNPYVNP